MNSFWHFFGVDTQTIGRKRYFISNITIWALWLVLFVGAGSLGLWEDGIKAVFTALILSFIGVFCIYIAFNTAIRRLRDFGASGWWSILLLISPISFIFMAFLCLKKGSSSSTPAPVVSNTPTTTA